MQLNPPLREEEFRNLAAGIKLLLMDVDGVMTDGRLFLVPDSDGNTV
jgi:3-deoxy-D-manno-octulosonate 8-phosphate phosphatase KdsC-like HAD superfamily phosphatase